MAEPLLSIKGLNVDYITDRGPVRAIDGLSLDLHAGEILGVAGESGSGKSTLAQAILRILPPPGVISGGTVRFEGKNILDLDEDGLRAIRWTRISMVFQSAMDALNPVLSIGEQIVDTLQAHGAISTEAARARARELLEMVEIPVDRIDAFPHQLSGGMRQRVGIALAMALTPSLVILDEPTTALDVVVERDILRRIRELQRKLGFAVMFITHDLARMLSVSDRVAIFYAARLVEVGPVNAAGNKLLHPYTQGLLHAFPSVKGDVVPVSIPGAPPSLMNPPTGCRFHPRCALAVDLCRESRPELRQFGPGHAAACHLAE